MHFYAKGSDVATTPKSPTDEEEVINSFAETFFLVLLDISNAPRIRLINVLRLSVASRLEFQGGS